MRLKGTAYPLFCLHFNRVLKMSVYGLVKKVPGVRLRRELSRSACEKPTSGGVLEQYVGARRLSATKQMGLFKQPVQVLTKAYKDSIKTL